MSSAQYFENLATQISDCQSCAQLQALAASSVESIGAMISGLTAQLAPLEALQALLEIPTGPDDVVTWVAGFITDYLTPQFSVLIKLQAQLIELNLGLTATVAAIAEKASEFTDCSIP